MSGCRIKIGTCLLQRFFAYNLSWTFPRVSSNIQDETLSELSWKHSKFDIGSSDGEPGGGGR